MGRKRIEVGPPGLCDNCGRRCVTLDQVGIKCFHCHAGRFVNLEHFVYTMCPDCGGSGLMCDRCKHTGVLATGLKVDNAAGSS